MRYKIKRSTSDPHALQLVLTAENNEEDEALQDLYTGGGHILALGETSRGKAELVIGTSPEIPE